MPEAVTTREHSVEDWPHGMKMAIGRFGDRFAVHPSESRIGQYAAR